MSERPERLFWVHGKEMAGSVADEIDQAIAAAVRGWNGQHRQQALCTSCVRCDQPSKRLWLFRMRCETPGEAIYGSFDEELSRLAARLKSSYKGIVDRKKRLLTPLLRDPVRMNGFAVDVGLHYVNNRYNATLTTFWYWDQGGTHHPPAYPISDARLLLGEVEPVWRGNVCDCRDTRCSRCKGEGCFECFKLGCSGCDGTGWRRFPCWLDRGCGVSYSTGFPIPVL